jgi:hypothetical protein
VKTTVDGITFHSKREAARYGELKLLEKAGEILDLKLQPSFVLMAPVIRGGVENINEGTIERVSPIGEYRADFSYIANGYRPVLDRLIVEDVKGFRTALYKWKKRHVERQYDITIHEI